MTMTAERQAPFKLDSIELLYHGLQECRHANPDRLTWAIPRRLKFLSATLAAVQRRGGFIVRIDSADLHQVPEWILLKGSASPEATSVSPTQRSALEFLQILLVELVRLAETGNIEAVRGLGYQFHNFPRALRADSPYDRCADAGSLRVAAAHWDKLSSEMRKAFSKHVGVDPAAIDALVRRKGFADTMKY